MEVYKGTVTRLENVRQDRPSVNAKRIGQKQTGEWIEISHAIKGEMHHGIDTWYVLTDQTFVWGGVVYTPVEVPILKKELIVTADDIGVVEEIDNGAKTALIEGRINSIAMFVNNPDDDSNQSHLTKWLNFLKRNRRGDSSQTLYDTTHVGLHFTVHSGGPTLDPQDVHHLMDGNCFAGYTKFNKDYKTKPFLDQIKAELDSQYEKFKKYLHREPDHLTSHYDVLTFNKPLFEHLYHWADDKGVPIRTHRFLPSSKRFWYDTLAIFRADIPSIRKMDRWEEELGLDVKSPNHTIVDHYGPLPPFAVTNYNRRVRKKQKKLKKWMCDFLVSKDTEREVVIHLLQSNIRRQKDFKRRFGNLPKTYPGVNIKQFDGRLAEFLSLEKHSPWKSNPELAFSPVNVRPV